LDDADIPLFFDYIEILLIETALIKGTPAGGEALFVDDFPEEKKLRRLACLGFDITACF
jgi:hypothetical protein